MQHYIKKCNKLNKGLDKVKEICYNRIMKKVDNIENFKAIKNYEDYLVNEKGQIYSKKRNCFIKPIKKQGSDYLSVNLYNEEGQKMIYIHRIVAQTFLELKDGKVVNHKDLDKTNNSLSNLEVVTQKENIRHAQLNNREIRSKGKDHPKHKTVAQYDLKGNLIKVWDSVGDVERETGIGTNYISNCALGKCKKSKGFIWKYI